MKHSITINANPAKVWRVLTDKELIKQYMFGTETTSNWEKGGRLTYSGEYKGHKYNDGGVIQEIEPEKILKHTYWSSMSGVEDVPENYATITYTISVDGTSTILTIEQENNPTETMRDNSDKHWPMVMEQMKSIAEDL